MKSSLYEHAEHELGLLLVGISDDAREVQEHVNKDILEMVEVFSRQGHSGLSAEYTLKMIVRLLDWKPLKPLLGTDEEWGTDASKYQNNRYPSVFKDKKTGVPFDVKAAPIFTENNGKSWFRSNVSRDEITFPYTVPDEYDTERLYLDKNNEWHTEPVSEENLKCREEY